MKLKHEIGISLTDQLEVKGFLGIPREADKLVIFSHGSGSSRHSSRNHHVADILNKHKIATLLTDLLTPEEDSDYENRFNIDLLTQRLVAITQWVIHQQDLRTLSIGYFGASTGAASALRAAAVMKDYIKAVVSRGGRVDLADGDLVSVKAPTLLIIGSLDKPVLAMNHYAYDLLHCEKEIKVINGATHLFEEPGKLDEVALCATKWFEKYLTAYIST
jgi:putative phosphoribosyl transferase